MQTVGRIWRMVVIFSVLLPPAVFAQTDSGNLSFTVVKAWTTKEKVVNIDYRSRKVTLKDDKGSVRTVHVGDAIGNIEQVRTGDEVTVETHQTISVEVQRGPGDTLNVGVESQTSAPPGAKPAGTRTIGGKLRTKVASINYDTRTITFKNRKGVLTTYQVGPQAKRFDEIRKGDMLVVEYSQTLTLTVK